MIQEREFWNDAKRGARGHVDGEFILKCLAVAFHRGHSTDAARARVSGAWLRSAAPAVATAQIVPSPSATPMSNKVLTPSASSSMRVPPPLEEPQSVITPSNQLHEPFVDLTRGVSPSNKTATPRASQAKSPSLLCRSGSNVKQKQGKKGAGGGPFDSTTSIKGNVVRLMQHTFMFMSPMSTWRYVVPGISMSFNSACIIEADTQRLVTFGSQSASVPTELRCRGCVAGDTFIAVVTDKNEVWISGSLDTGNGSITGTNDTMRGIATRSLMISGHGSRLLSLTKGFTVRPLSVITANTRSVFPSRLVRFLDVGIGDDCFMVGVDSVIYKTTINQRNISTPRRVMTLARTPIARVASGMGFHILIDEAGRVLTVGKNKKGQLGNGLKQDSMRRPYVIDTLAPYYAIQVAAGECHSLVLTSGGDVFGSGSNEYGQLGFGPVPEVTKMTKIQIPGKCIGIAAGPLGSMFALNDGRVFTCGFNDVQQLGLGVDYQAQRTVLVPTCIPTQIIRGVHIDDVNVAESIKATDGPSITSPTDTAFALSRSMRGTPLGSQGTPPKTKTNRCQKCCAVM